MKLNRLGDGTMGHTWKAVDMSDGRVVVLKRLPRHYDEGLGCSDVRRLARILKLVHPNICALLDVKTRVARPNCYLVYEYCAASTLWPGSRSASGATPSPSRIRCCRLSHTASDLANYAATDTSAHARLRFVLKAVP